MAACWWLALASGVVSVRGADQPQWGQAWTRNMVSAETGLAASFDPESGRNIKWSAALGEHTYGSPVVANGRVLIGTDNEAPRDPRRVGDRGVLLCLNEADGSLMWQLVVPKLTTSVFWDWPRSGLCSPPSVEGDRVYVVSNRGEVMCLDLNGLADGNDGPFQDEARHATPEGETPIPLGDLDADILWLYDLVGELNVRQHDSAHASILIDGEFLYVNTSNGVDDTHRFPESPDAPSLVVLDKRTGRLVGHDRESIGPRIFHCTWSSPSLAEVNGQRLIFFGGGDGRLYAFHALDSVADGTPGDPAGLRREWVYDPDPDSPKEDVGQYLRNRREGPSTIMGMPVPHDGRLYVAGGGDYWWGKREAWLHCVDAASGNRIWASPLQRHTMSTPAVQDGSVYITDCAGTIHCLDANTGESIWTLSVRGEIWSSPLVADGKLYVTTQHGELLTLAAGQSPRELGRTQLDGQISASPVAANGVLYITTPRTLFAVQIDGT